ncbi:MAG: hypothetical protein AAF206_11915 [Bacteroidota bacterium]
MSLINRPLSELQEEVILKNKNGVSFLLAASIIWLGIALIWFLPGNDANHALYTFFATGPMLPLAWLFTKQFKAAWNIPDNPLNPLGLWLNFAQLFYFPFLFLIYSRTPEDLVMGYAILTGAHFFPYGWFYNTKAYAVMAGVIAIGATAMGVMDVAPSWIAIAMAGSLLVLSGWVYTDYQKVAKAAAKVLS